MIEKAKLKQIGVDRLKVCDATDLPYKNDEFDYNYSIGSLEHFTKDGIIKLFNIPKDIINDLERQRRVYSLQSKSPTLLARSDTTKILDDKRIRKLTPLECERLQNIPDNYTACCSDTQRYKMIGNAFNVDTIAHILKGLKNSSYIERKKKPRHIKEKIFA